MDKLDSLQILIPSFELREDGARPAIHYNLELSLGPVRWTLSKRYSDFFALNQYIAANFMPIASFPPKTMLSRLNPAFAEKRRAELDFYLHAS